VTRGHSERRDDTEGGVRSGKARQGRAGEGEKIWLRGRDDVEKGKCREVERRNGVEKGYREWKLNGDWEGKRMQGLSTTTLTTKH
jgi:hypothetical protein